MFQPRLDIAARKLARDQCNECKKHQQQIEMFHPGRWIPNGDHAIGAIAPKAVNHESHTNHGHNTIKTAIDIAAECLLKARVKCRSHLDRMAEKQNHEAKNENGHERIPQKARHSLNHARGIVSKSCRA